MLLIAIAAISIVKFYLFFIVLTNNHSRGTIRIIKYNDNSNNFTLKTECLYKWAIVNE